MALNIKNPEVENLASQVARMEGTTKTEVIRRALAERKHQLASAPEDARKGRLRRYLELRVWPNIPAEARRRWSKEEEARHLGYGKQGEPV